MPNSQVKNGKAFEYACMVSLKDTLEQEQSPEILLTRSFVKAKVAFENLTNNAQRLMLRAGNAAVRAILPLEPQLTNSMGNDPLYLSIQEDRQGQTGDVRDIIMIRRQNDWEIGISAKHNHTAVKHSRLSQTIDFGRDWLGVPCHQSYFDDINPYFAELAQLRESGNKWRDINFKKERFYIPVLEAFKLELLRLYEEHGENVPSRLLKYLLGRHDFYKVIAKDPDELTIVQAFCINGELNRPAGENRPQTRVAELRLPRIIHSVDFKEDSKTTIKIVCDEGWGISARIHSAATRVEPSLKLDINLIGVPPYLYTQHVSWD